MRIKITNPKHQLYRREYEVVYMDGEDYRVKMEYHDQIILIRKEDCDELEND